MIVMTDFCFCSADVVENKHKSKTSLWSDRWRWRVQLAADNEGVDKYDVCRPPPTSKSNL
jgi:N-acyl-L-homoserine lactone synthetase